MSDDITSVFFGISFIIEANPADPKFPAESTTGLKSITLRNSISLFSLVIKLGIFE